MGPALGFNGESGLVGLFSFFPKVSTAIVVVATEGVLKQGYARVIIELVHRISMFFFALKLS